MGKPCEPIARDISSKFSVLLPFRAIYFSSYNYETPYSKISPIWHCIVGIGVCLEEVLTTYNIDGLFLYIKVNIIGY